MHRVLALIATSLGIALLLQQGYLLQTSPSIEKQSHLFQDVSWKAGILNNREVSIEMAVGQAWGDYDNDGWIDLYVTDPKGPNTLYHNQGDGTFKISPLSKEVALSNKYSSGAIFTDYDNDGWKDLMVVNWGTNSLFHNEGGVSFQNVTRKAGIVDEKNSKSASWGDFDNDGFVDVYIANWSCYPRCGRTSDGESDHLYRNNGDGSFTDVSDYLGGGLNGAGFIASFNDYDNDGDADIYLVNDEFINPIGNKLWRNDGPGCGGWCFKQVAAEAGADSKLFGMGLAVVDYDNNGSQDFYFSNVGPMELLENQGDGTFTENAANVGVQSPDNIGWAVLSFDYDNDGWRDLYLTVSDTVNHRDIPANKLFRNKANRTFELVNCNNDAADVHPSLGAAYGDYNHDGWLDLVVGNMDEGYRLYQNQTGLTSDNHWLVMELIGGGLVNNDAVGARVYLTTTDGLTQMQEVINGSGLGGGSELTLYFGLKKSGSANLEVHWPDGAIQYFENVKANQRYRLEYSSDGKNTLEVLPHISTADNYPSQLTAQQSQNIILFLSSFLLIGLGISILLRTSVQQFRWIPLPIAILTLVSAYGLVSSAIGSPAWRLLSTDSRLNYLMEQADVQPPTRPDVPAPELVNLGEALFWDPELGGNRDTACVTCHHPLTSTGDNLSLSIGTGGIGLGETRVKPDDRHEFVPRNAQPLYNLGYTEWISFFWDGRISGDAYHGYYTPVSDRLPPGLNNLLAAQALFPLTSRDEMRGLRGDKDIFGQVNELAKITDYSNQEIWDSIMKRLLAIPAYVELFRAVYPELAIEEFGIQHAVNAISAYENVTFTFEDSPFDRYIRGDLDALSPEAKRGGILFFDKAGCGTCHSGPLLTDQQFYNMAVPQIGPGKGREQPYDLGRARETGNDCDRFAFRTPPLRNVSITGPWMHNGSFVSLEAVIRHHLNPVESLRNYNPKQLAIELQDTSQDQPDVLASVAQWYTNQNTSEGIKLSEREIQDLMAFLDSLTSPTAKNLEFTTPESVPSGLPVGGNIHPPGEQTNLP